MGEELIDVLILQKVCMVLLFSGAPFFFLKVCFVCCQAAFRFSEFHGFLLMVCKYYWICFQWPFGPLKEKPLTATSAQIQCDHNG